jgi:signal transduction histidine kinase
MDLRPSMLDDLGLLATLSWFCRRFQTIYSWIRIEQKIDIKEDEVPDSLKTTIFRITQEAMNNAAKHGKPRLISLSLNGEGKTIELVIKDNGTGFDIEEMLAKKRSSQGLGLESMRERTELSGGSFIIESARDKGTVIRTSWPTELQSR